MATYIEPASPKERIDDVLAAAKRCGVSRLAQRVAYARLRATPYRQLPAECRFLRGLLKGGPLMFESVVLAEESSRPWKQVIARFFAGRPRT